MKNQTTGLLLLLALATCPATAGESAGEVTPGNTCQAMRAQSAWIPGSCVETDPNKPDGLVARPAAWRNIRASQRHMILNTPKKDRIPNRPTGNTLGEVNFKSGETVVNQHGDDVLYELATAIQANPTMRYKVDGHADCRGPDELNWKLSLERANNVRDVLIKWQAPADRIIVEPFGETRPLPNMPCETGANRRAFIHPVDELHSALPATATVLR